MADETGKRRESEAEMRRLIQNLDADALAALVEALDQVAKTTSFEALESGDPHLYQYN